MSKTETSFDDLMSNVNDSKTKIYPRSTGYPYDQPNSNLPQVQMGEDGIVRSISAPLIEIPQNTSQPVNITYNFDMSSKTIVNNVTVKKTSNNASLAVGDAVIGAIGGMLGKIFD